MLKKLSIALISSFFLFSGIVNSSTKDGIIVNLKEKGASVAPSMYGVFFEEINHAGDGGLYAELIQNRGFSEAEMPEGFSVEENKLIPKPIHYHLTGEIRKRSYGWHTEKIKAWSLSEKDSTKAHMYLTKELPKFETNPNNIKINITKISQTVQLINEGYWGINLEKGEKYHLRTIIRLDKGYSGKVIVKLASSDGKVLSSTPIKMKANNQWFDLKNVLIPNATDAKSKLVIEFDAPGKIWIDYVSLFPEKTFNNRSNGLRKDVAEMLVGLKPTFFRWPGGCVVEGITLDNRFEWKKTLGDPAARPGEYSTWGYRCSYGFGYYEMLQFCEDIGAKAMFVCNVGLGCQFRMGDACPQDQIEYYLNDCLDAIEYALGDSSSKWGARRAADGHPAPFPLQYIEIGNENWGPEYDKRFDLFYKVIKEKHPNLTLIYNEMPEREGKSLITKTDMIDPHWYVDPNFFFRNSDLFDSYERGKYTVYVGEYACNRGVGGGNMLAALSEAAFICGMERNGDLVTMTSYAPLLENKNDRNWATNLIWLDNKQVVGRSSYYVQKMAAENKPSYNLKSNKNFLPTGIATHRNGYWGFGTKNASIEFKNIKVTHNGISINTNLDQSIIKTGNWKLENNKLLQHTAEDRFMYLLNNPLDGEYIIELKVRKLDGREGFSMYFGMSEDSKDGYLYNIGTWSNNRSELLELTDGQETGVLAERPGRGIPEGKWNDIKVIVSPRKSEFYLNGELLMSHSPKIMPTQFFSTGYDESANEVIIKVVNPTSSVFSTKIQLDGASNVIKEGKVITLSASNEKDENSFEEPKKIYPQERIYNEFDRNFVFDFDPFSYTILRIKANK